MTGANTIKFTVPADDKENMRRTLRAVFDALNEKGYNPINQLVPVQLTDHAAGIVVVGDIGGIFCQQIADDLVDGIVTLLLQSVKYRAQNPTHIVLVIAGNSEFQCVLISHGIDLLRNSGVIISHKNGIVKT